MKNKILALLIFFTLISNPLFVIGCNCDVTENESLKMQINKAIKHSIALFSGEVIEVKKYSLGVEVKIKVEKSWKNISKKVVTINTGRGGGDCGYKFELGKRYLIYSYGEKNNLQTNICQRTNEIENAENDLLVLGKGKIIK